MRSFGAKESVCRRKESSGEERSLREFSGEEETPKVERGVFLENQELSRGPISSRSDKTAVILMSRALSSVSKVPRG